MVVGWSIADHMHAELVVDAWPMALGGAYQAPVKRWPVLTTIGRARSIRQRWDARFQGPDLGVSQVLPTQQRLASPK